MLARLGTLLPLVRLKNSFSKLVFHLCLATIVFSEIFSEITDRNRDLISQFQTRLGLETARAPRGWNLKDSSRSSKNLFKQNFLHSSLIYPLRNQSSYKSISIYLLSSIVAAPPTTLASSASFNALRKPFSGWLKQDR